MDATTVQASLRDLLRAMRGGAVDDLAADDNLVASLHLESIELIELITQIEARFGIAFGDSPEALADLEALSQLVLSRLSPPVRT
jgi:acyl carrier protein